MNAPRSAVSNMKRLAIHKMALDAVPPGGGFGDALRFLSSSAGIASAARAADQWARDAVAAIRNAEDPNPWRDIDDEDIAGEILRQIEDRKRLSR